VQNKSFLIDASHENSIDESGKKNPLRQPEVVWESLKISREIGLDKELKGWMMESFLLGGQQNCSSVNFRENLEYGKSITDACLGWEKTEKFIEELSKKLAKND
jgi:3-deoxy-7-phosphoheptulonate synthase